MSRAQTFTLQRLRRALADAPPPPQARGSLTPAGVLVPLFRRDGRWFTLLTKRSQGVAHHKGEVCFPGGAQDPEDRDLLATALRETWEEVGIRPEDVEVIGPLEPIATFTGFLISPYVGRVPYPYHLRPNPQEIAEVLEVPLDALADPSHHREEAYLHREGLVTAIGYAYNNRIVYGATARIITALLARLARVKE